MLSPLQQRIARFIGPTIEGNDFALAGSGALVSRGDVDRFTPDLDFLGLALSPWILYARSSNRR
jgi:hypothetical protein